MAHNYPNAIPSLSLMGQCSLGLSYVLDQL